MGPQVNAVTEVNATRQSEGRPAEQPSLKGLGSHALPPPAVLMRRIRTLAEHFLGPDGRIAQASDT
jgi:hypothetical protein